MKLGLLGKSLDHSFSKKFFETKFLKEGIENHSYQNIELESLESVCKEIDARQLNGFNITIPYKEEIIKHLDAIDVAAAEINAVNVVKIEGGRWTGYNTDYSSFGEALLPLIDGPISALILGSGGASKAISYALRKMGITARVVSRQSEYLNYTMLNRDLFEQNNLIINATPLGTYPAVDECPTIPYDLLTEQHICYDLIYNPEKTTFLKNAESQGAKIINGKEMLEIQANKSWEIWNS